jgi:16S rRNA (cytosine967-C5)-methyltransferase
LSCKAQTQDRRGGQHFDKILLDAPCSATGVIRRHPDIKLLRKPKDIRNLECDKHQWLDLTLAPVVQL